MSSGRIDHVGDLGDDSSGTDEPDPTQLGGSFMEAVLGETNGELEPIPEVSAATQ